MYKEIKVNEEGLVSLNDIARILCVDLREWITKKETIKTISKIESILTGKNPEVVCRLFGTRGGIPQGLHSIQSFSGRYGGGTYAHELITLEFLYAQNTYIKSAILSMQFGLHTWEHTFKMLFEIVDVELFKRELKEIMEGEGTQVGVLLELLTKYELKNNKQQKRVVKEFVYLYHTKGGTKIGKTANPKERFKSINTSCPHELIQATLFEVSDSEIVERSIHVLYSEKNIKGEWFDIQKEDADEIGRLLQLSPLWISTKIIKNSLDK